MPLHIIPVMHHTPEDEVHGFVCHDACWSVFQKAIQLDNISLYRILEICNSLPSLPGRSGFFWGHNYGGLGFIDKGHEYPWERRVMHTDLKTVEMCRENPCEVPEITELVTSALRFPQSSTHLPDYRKMSSDLIRLASLDQPELSQSASRLERKDELSTLPVEILETIASYLPTQDALSLRFASKAFNQLTSSQTFWASRFESEHERGFLFETQDSKHTGNWLALYNLTEDTNLSPGLKNRKRVWNLSRIVRNLLRLHLTTEDATSSLPSSSLGNSELTVVNAFSAVEPD